MCELNDIARDIENQRDRQNYIKKEICEKINDVYGHYVRLINNGYVIRKIKLSNYKLKTDGIHYSLYANKKYILEYHRYGCGNSYLKVDHFDNTFIIEMQDFNDKLVEMAKSKLIAIRDKEADEAIEMVALKSLA